MLTFDFVSQVSLSQVVINVKNVVLAHTHSSGIQLNAKIVSKMLSVMVVQILRFHQSIGEEPQIRLKSYNDWTLMHAKEATIQIAQTQCNEPKGMKATCELNEKLQKIISIKEQQTMFERSDQTQYWMPSE